MIGAQKNLLCRFVLPRVGFFSPLNGKIQHDNGFCQCRVFHIVSLNSVVGISNHFLLLLLMCIVVSVSVSQWGDFRNGTVNFCG